MQNNQMINETETLLSLPQNAFSKNEEQNESKPIIKCKKYVHHNNLISEKKNQNWNIFGRNVNNLCMPYQKNHNQNGKFLFKNFLFFYFKIYLLIVWYIQSI